ncbi:hypothetical protein EDB81DRAFT_906601 [Dactylonectria macrodidyma]|uniref:Uncharacterized protein n=1 Tax=Dactylonectria macrodidyma TaxID=307937 RepID=A0A9P9E124_9HYPO|nr:hypothetical protein EDB81DRAFT_906601 [Dactylonectria macrodidyma]
MADLDISARPGSAPSTLVPHNSATTTQEEVNATHAENNTQLSPLSTPLTSPASLASNPVASAPSPIQVSSPPSPQLAPRSTENGSTPLTTQRPGTTPAATAPAPALTQTPNPSTPITMGMRLENTIRQYRLQVTHMLYQTLNSKPRAQGRVVMFKDRLATALALWYHFPPILVVIVMTRYLIHGYFVGNVLQGPSPGKDQPKLVGLQIMAKLHELLMVGSLASLIFTLIRMELCKGRGVPFSAITAKFHIADVSFLWSKEFIAICLGDFSSPISKRLLVTLIAICTALTVALAPASATVLIPQSRMWEAGGTELWFNSTKDHMWPLNINESHILGQDCLVAGDPQCPSAHWHILNIGFARTLPWKGEKRFSHDHNLNVPGNGSEVVIKVHTASPPVTFDSVAMVPHMGLSRAISDNAILWDDATQKAWLRGYSRFKLRTSERFEMRAPSYKSYTRCQGMNYAVGASISDDDAAPIFPDPRKQGNPGNRILKNPELRTWRSQILNATEPDVLWLSSGSWKTYASLRVAVAIPDSTFPTHFHVYGCFMDVRRSETLYSQAMSYFQVHSDDSDFRIPAKKRRLINAWGRDVNASHITTEQVQISPDYLQYLNPRLTKESKDTVFSQLALSSRLWTPKEPGIGSSNAYHLEAILNVMLLNGLARIDPHTTTVGTLRDKDTEWWKGVLPDPKDVFAFGSENGTAYDVTDAEKEGSVSYHLKVYAGGYGYYLVDGSSVGGLAILWLYVVVISPFIVWSVYTGTTSTSWDSMGEMLALAMKSPIPPESQLVGTSAGISSFVPLRERYYLRDSDGRLILRSKQDRASTDQEVKVNTVYNNRKKLCFFAFVPANPH